ncbi:PrgH/EprH family type III secretion apparatus protein [Providencia stuartii]|uniref:PrgH/EprH family type III secretion apparatus protein n=1 Tax=Providencia TaxID=586 RepID=UPI0028C19F2D|nr:PrgH/EprH family type III secretion apparatus protein [Providencia stuartii]MDT7051030.1 PrgH/EprH family type III secretion apparatus protein [Providencia stuartii]
MKDTNSRACIMKIASGPMNGHELMLTADAHLIVIDPNVEYHTEVDNDGLMTYYIPSESIHYELAITTEDGSNDHINDADEPIFYLHINDGMKSKSIPIPFQELILADTFPIAIKPIDAPWNLSTREPALPEICIENDSQPMLESKLTKKNFIFFGLFVLTIFSIILVIQYYSGNNSLKKINTVENILQGSHYPIIVTLNQQGETLILVRTQRDVDWSIQRLRKEHYSEKYQITKIAQLESEIENKISENVPSLLKIDLSNPCHPIVRKANKQATTKDEKIINNIMKGYLGCYKNSEILTVNLDELIKKAEIGLTESNVPWKRVDKDNMTIFIVQGSLDDKQISSTVRLADQFINQWGNQHIQFSISLATNQLTGKSFIRNDQGFIILGHNHWSFNSNTIN